MQSLGNPSKSYMLRMDDPSQDPVDVEGQFDSGFQSQCTVSSNNPSGDKIVKMKVLDTKPAGTVTLESLSVEDVCYLLDYSKLNAITSVARENQFSGIILATGVESANDLKEFGIKAMFAQSLFKHILKWKAEGIPADIFTARDAAASPAGVAPTVFTSVGATNIVAGVRLRPAQPFLRSSNSTEKPFPVCRFVVMEIRALQAALRALENDLHHDSGRMVLGLTNKYDCLCCYICKPKVSRECDPRPQNDFWLSCLHNCNLVNKVQQLAGESKKYKIGWVTAAIYSEVLQLGKKRLQELQR